MKNYAFLYVFLITSCFTNDSSSIDIGNLPEKQSIDSLKQTDFVGTIQNDISASKNYIYSPTLAFAWNELKDTLKNIQLDKNTNHIDFLMLNTTKSHLNTLNPNEFKTEIIIQDSLITARAEFNLQLSFKPFLEKFTYPMNFKNIQVDGFGMLDWDIEKARQLEILYYENNNNFIIRLLPNELDNELIFVFGLNSEKLRSFSEVIDLYQNKMKIGRKEADNKKSAWKYKLEPEETFEIPEIQFNLEKSYESLSGQRFIASNLEHEIVEAKQRNALLLNNKGAKIESEAEITETAVEAIDEPVKVQKHLVLDDTFFLFIKHKGQKNPYFCVKIDNAELLLKRNTSN